MAASIPAESDTQERVFTFLSDPATHPDVHRIDTHGASVFLEGQRALKIKRAVRFPFLDYSTLAKRKAACDEEIRINRPFAPQIYRRVVPITQSADGSLEIDGPGAPVEFAIEMTRFDERQTLDHLAEADPLDPALVDAVAEAVAASHHSAPLAPAEPWIRSIRGIIEGNTAAFREAACFPAGEIDDLEQASLSAFSRLRGLLERRGRQEYVRRCHGDLHLANIVVIGDRPVLFDAIEFDPVIASVDVLYDLAFAIMDFLRYNRPAAANALLNRYLAITSEDNLDALAALPLFMSLRSAIRTHVLLARISRNSRDGSSVMRSARAYFELAQRTIRPSAPSLVAVGGLSGTGKSVLARALAPAVPPQPGAVVLRTDVLRKQYFQIQQTDRLPESAYRPEVTEKIYETLLQRASRILVQGHSVVVDAVFAHAAERSAISEVARKLNVRFSGLFLVTDLATRQRRVGLREADASDATPEIAGLQEKYDIGAMDWTVVDASGTPEQTLEQCLPHLMRPTFPRKSRGNREFPSPVAKQVATRHVMMMFFPPSSKPAGNGTAGAERTRPGRNSSAPPLTAAMACDTAFRIVAGHYLKELTAHHEATCTGDAGALHEMRIALTRLRTAIAFFSPMVAGPQQTRLADELKWLNTHLGAVRDLDVAIERLKEIKPRSQVHYRSWSRERAETQRHLTRALRSPRYRRLIKSISHWIAKGTWSTKRGTQAANQRACPIAEYGTRKLMRWREKLIRKSRKLEAIGTEKRHRVRLLNKRLGYAIEAIAGLASKRDILRLQATLKVLRKAQRSLGQLNDDARCQSLAATLGQRGAAVSRMLLGPRHEKRLIRTAAATYEKLAELKPFRI